MGNEGILVWDQQPREGHGRENGFREIVGKGQLVGRRVPAHLCMSTLDLVQKVAEKAFSVWHTRNSASLVDNSVARKLAAFDQAAVGLC